MIQRGGWFPRTQWPGFRKAARVLFWPDLSRVRVSDSERALLPAAVLGFAIIDLLWVAAFGLTTALVIIRGGDSAYRYVIATGTSILVLGGMAGLVLSVRIVIRYRVGRRQRGR